MQELPRYPLLMGNPGTLVVPLLPWAPVHPAALEHEGQSPPPAPPPRGGRNVALVTALAARNAAWGNPVEDQLQRWLAGAEVVVAGQQPGLLGGPLLTLVKACAVAAEVRRRQAAGREAVGFFWLATNDDDLPEMGWGRVVTGEEVKSARESSWRRGEAVAGAVPLGTATAQLLAALEEQTTGERARDAMALAARCYRPGVPLGEATGFFLSHLLRGLGVVLVDALEPALMVAAREALMQTLVRLPEAWRLLEEAGNGMRARGWPVPLSVSATRLPIFRLNQGRRERLATSGGACPPAVLQEVERHPQRFSPNVWLRPLLQDAALGTGVSLLGGAELAYHHQARELWELTGVARPEWRLRPHVTVVTAAERRLVRQLGVTPEDLLSRRPPPRLLAGSRVQRRQAALRRLVESRLAALAEATRQELPSLAADVQATTAKVTAALHWLAHRTDLAEVHSRQVHLQRWRRLVAFLRPDGLPQERRLSVLAPLLRLGLEWPAQLAATLDPSVSGMSLMCWEEGGKW